MIAPIWAALAFIVVTSVGASAPGLNEAGMAAYTRGDYAEAERLFRQATTTAPREPLYRYHLGVALTRLGRYPEAADAYQATLRLSPEPSLAAFAQQGLHELSAPRSGRRAAAEPDKTSIRLEPFQGGWVTRVKLNDWRTARFLVDTGASMTAISRALAAELGIRPNLKRQTRAVIRGVGGVTTGRLVRIASISVGDIEATNVEVAIIDAEMIFEGILGNTFLSRYTVQIDPRRGVLSLRPP